MSFLPISIICPGRAPIFMANFKLLSFQYSRGSVAFFLPCTLYSPPHLEVSRCHLHSSHPYQSYHWSFFFPSQWPWAWMVGWCPEKWGIILFRNEWKWRRSFTSEHLSRNTSSESCQVSWKWSWSYSGGITKRKKVWTEEIDKNIKKEESFTKAFW